MPRVEQSAGGVVVDGEHVLLIRVRSLKGDIVHTLPKGLVGAGEPAESAALREVEEETGYRCSIESELPTAEYWYRRQGLLVHKSVRWFVMQPLERTGQPDPAEVIDVEWLPLLEARQRLTYPGDRKLLDLIPTGGQA
jgi:ADP-ribose pyrophosphatase YjhB (NUDIX family)